MMTSRVPADRALARDELRRAVARIEGRVPAFDPEGAADDGWRFGIGALDRAIGGALSVAALHTLHAAEVGDVPAAQGFALALAARSGRAGGLLWVATTRHVREWGLPYGPGLRRYGCDPTGLLVVEARRVVDAGWALEEALRSGAFALLIGAGLDADFTVSRRLGLAAADRATPCLLIDPPGREVPSAAATRWRIAAALSGGDAFDPQSPGCPRWRAELIRSRVGPPAGPWELEWDEQTHRFALAAAPADRTVAPPARPAIETVAGGLRAERGRTARA